MPTGPTPSTMSKSRYQPYPKTNEMPKATNKTRNSAPASHLKTHHTT